MTTAYTPAAAMDASWIFVPAADFALADHLGSVFRLSEHLGAGPLILIFFRGHWCPYCRRYLAKLQASHTQFLQQRVQLVGISPESLSAAADLASELKLNFPLLCDTEGRVIDLYGVRNRFGAVRSLLPHPAVFILDPKGNVRFRSIDRNYKKRTPVPTLFRVIRALQK